jgi:putative ABC transport system permease protein
MKEKGTMNNLIRDVRYAVRTLLRNPAFSFFAVLTLALGIGVNTAIFSVADAVLFRSLPFADPERIVMVWENNPHLKLGVDKLPASPADFLDWREQNKVFQDIAAFTTFSYSLSEGDTPEKIDSVMCSAGFFNALGTPPAQGRTFAPGEDKTGNNHVAVISDNLWRRRFGADAQLLGKTLTLTGEKYTVIGIMPPGFDFPQNATFPNLGFTRQTELWTPLVFDEATAKDRRTLAFPVIARLKPGVSVAQAQAEMSVLEANIDREYKQSAGFGTTLVDLREQMVGEFRLALLVLLGTVGFVLLIACANVANLLLAWFLRRQKEFAVRTALGATRAHLIRQMLTESILLAVGGGALGLLLAKWGTSALLALSPDNIPRANEVGINGWVLGFTFGISLLTGVLMGLAPALQASKTDLNSVLKEESRGGTQGVRSRQLRNLLIVSEVSLTLVLLIGAGLLVRSFWLLQQVSLGFNQDNILTMQMVLPTHKYPDNYRRAEVVKQILQRISTLPEAEAAAAATSLPLTGSDSSTFFEIEKRPASSPQNRPLANFILISPDFFNVMQIPLVRGRAFTAQDTDNSPPVAIVNEAMAKTFWPNDDPLGQRLSMSLEEGKVQREIVGIVGDVRSASLSTDPKPAIYVPYAQNSYELVYLGVRTKSDPLSMASAIRREVLFVDKEQPVYDIKGMNQVIRDSSARQNFNMLLLTIFAALALTLAMVGVYGVVASSVSQRTVEIGIRMALGAQQRDILKLFLRQGMLLILIGLIIGLAVAFVLTRMMSSLLYQINSTDPVTFLIAILGLTIISFFAIYIPARRAARLEPVIAIRGQ